MALKDTISNDLVSAMKAKDAVRVSVIRLVISAIKNREIDGGGPLDDEGVTGVLTSMSKQMKDSIQQYEKGGRADLADREKAELEVVMGYMPEQMGPDEVEAAVKQAVAETGAEGPGDMGKVMKAVMPKLKGRADGKLVNELVKKILG